VHSKFVDQFASCAVLGAGLLAKRRRGRRLELDAQHTLSASLESISLLMGVSGDTHRANELIVARSCVFDCIKTRRVFFVGNYLATSQ